MYLVLRLEYKQYYQIRLCFIPLSPDAEGTRCELVLLSSDLVGLCRQELNHRYGFHSTTQCSPLGNQLNFCLCFIGNLQKPTSATRKKNFALKGVITFFEERNYALQRALLCPLKGVVTPFFQRA